LIYNIFSEIQREERPIVLKRIKNSDENKTTTELLSEAHKYNSVALFLSGMSIGISFVTILFKTLRLLGYI